MGEGYQKIKTRRDVMTEKDFLHDLRRGLGGAVIELQKNPDRYKYRDIVLRCCLKNIAYDTQCEGTKGHYLYTAVCALGAKDEFEDILIGAFMNRLELHFFSQLFDILRLYADDGSEKAKNALRKKYQSLAEQLTRQRTFPFKYCEREQFEALMEYEVITNKWPAFKKCVEDAGRIIIKRNDDDGCFYECFIEQSEDVFGKERVARYFDTASEKSAEAGAFVASMRNLQEIQEENRRLRTEPEVTLDSYIAIARELEKSEYPLAEMMRFTHIFSRQGTTDDFLNLVSVIEGEQSDEIKAKLLTVFRRIKFPGDIELLIKYAQSDYYWLQYIAVEALERFKDQRVHDLAIKFIESGNLEAGLPLLIKNWRGSDEPLIRERVLASKRASHSLQWNLRDIYGEHSSKTCGDILEHAYRNGDCSYCRSSIVKVMQKNRVLSADILNECLYDSYDDTRKMAQRIQKRK